MISRRKESRMKPTNNEVREYIVGLAKQTNNFNLIPTSFVECKAEAHFDYELSDYQIRLVEKLVYELDTGKDFNK